MSENSGVLYVVATPIGNLADLGRRAIEVLSEVDVIAAEDTRHTRKLLNHYNIKTAVLSCHEHNEARVSGELVQRLCRGDSVALVSDAGTPLISDPGFPLIQAARQAGIRVSPIPGPSAAIAALSVSGLASDHFFFEGFLPQKGAARRKRLAALKDIPATLILYESPHRIRDTLTDVVAEFGADHPLVLARELTKLYESVQAGTAGELLQWCDQQPQQVKGEMVLVLAAARAEPAGGDQAALRRLLGLLLQEMPVKKAVSIAAELTGERRNTLYDMAIAVREEL